MRLRVRRSWWKSGIAAGLISLGCEENISPGSQQTGRIMSGSLGIGSRFPTFCTSMGRALLAHLPSEEPEKYFRTRNFNLSPVKRQLGLGKSNRG